MYLSPPNLNSGLFVEGVAALERQPPRAEEICQRGQPRAHMQEWPVQW